MARYDILILGAGAAGCALAGRLSEESDRTVCLVEAGPDYGHLSAGRWPADILDPHWLALESHLWERDVEEDRSQARARILGGCSAHTRACCSRARPPTTTGAAAGRTSPPPPPCAAPTRHCAAACSPTTS